MQKTGTAMGTRLAPSYANLYMESVEKTALRPYEKQPLIWLRYIDDIFFLWTHIEKWVTHLNQFHETIKFTVEYSKESIHFLDTWVKTDETGKLYTDLYRKPTDVNNYLNFTSAHPPATKKSLPYSQFLRLLRICIKPEDFEKHCTLKIKEVEEKGYPRIYIDNALEKAKSQNRSEALKQKNKKGEKS